MQVSMAQTKMNSIHKMSHKANGAAKTSRGRHNSSGNLLKSICANQFNYSGSIGLYTKNGLNEYSTNVNISITNINISITGSINKPEIDRDKLRELIDNSVYFDTHGDMGECEGVKFFLSDIKPMKTYGLEENKAVNNVLDFGDMKYSKYVSSDGKEHVLYARHAGGIGTPFSNLITGVERDEETERYASFWRFYMSRDTVYVNLTFSNDEITKYLEEAGIEKGFFTIKSGEKEITKYYSSTKNTNIIQDKWRYDLRYQSIALDGTLLSNYEPGSVFKVNGKEYALNENHTLDVSYGEDIYCLEYPSNYRFGKKID